MTWEDKAHAMILALCTASWRQVNINPRTGRPSKKPRQYTVPPLAQELVDALGQQDEEKAIFLARADNPQFGDS